MTDFDVPAAGSAPASGRPLTGRKVLAIVMSFFAVIIAVNLTLAVQAVRTFPGLEVANSYVASQSFDAERAAQARLGWKLAVTASADRIMIGISTADGSFVRPASLAASVGRATEASDDRELAFVLQDGAYVAPVSLAPGKWVMWLKATAADGTLFGQRVTLHVKG